MTEGWNDAEAAVDGIAPNTWREGRANAHSPHEVQALWRPGGPMENPFSKDERMQARLNCKPATWALARLSARAATAGARRDTSRGRRGVNRDTSSAWHPVGASRSSQFSPAIVAAAYTVSHQLLCPFNYI